VSCCAVLYDRIGAGGAVAVAAGGLLSGRAWLMIAVALCLTAAGWGARLRHRPLLTGKRNMVLVAAGTLLWLYAVRQAVLHGVAPYVFQVLHHPCPWCLFLVEHDMMGVLLFGPPLLVLFEITAILTASVLRDAYPALAEPALARVRRAGSRLVVFMLFFTCAATAPVFNWWVRFGGWMDK
ncbi:MAG: hypothetical protein HKP58_07640, partial [Desulfatitalea sp.]|nr:hypothetical protein [Desulfatitalea sp.]NNK00271.1 hypothetical protein [Desulfatitalea sp.]